MSSLSEDFSKFLIGVNPEAALIQEGLDPAAVTGIQEDIRSSYREITGGGYAGTPTFEESQKELQSYTQAMSYLNPVALYGTQRLIKDKFAFETAPAFNVLSNLGSGLASHLGDAIATAETMRFEIGQIVGLGAQGLYQVARIAPRVVRWFRGARAFGRGAGAAAAALAAPETAGTSLAVLALWTLFDLTVGQLILWIGQRVGEEASKEYAYRMARQKFAANLLDKSQVVRESKTFLGVLAGGDYAGEGGYGLLNEIRASGAFGVNVGAFGYDYEAVGDAVKASARMSPTRDIRGFTAQSLAVSNLLGVDDSIVRTSMAALSRIPHESTDKITEEFINFFAALSGDGAVLTSQTTLAAELANFANTYGYGTKFSIDAPAQLANIVGFLTGTEMGRVQSTQPALALITSLDDVLMAGAVLENPRANELLMLSGISQAEAVRGLTGDATVLPRLISGIRQKTGISTEHFKDGAMTDEGYERLLPYLTEGLGMDMSMVQPVVLALEASLAGRTVGPNLEAYARAGEEMTGRGDRALKLPVLNLVEIIAEQSVVLSDAIRNNLDSMVTIHDILMDLVGDAVVAATVSAEFARKVADMLGMDSTPRSSRTLEQVAAAASAKFIPFAALAQGTAASFRGYYPQPDFLIPELDNATFETIREVVHPSYRGYLTKEFIEGLLGAANELGLNPLVLLGIIGYETGVGSRDMFSARARNKSTRATGLIQFMPSTAEGLGTTVDDLFNMTVTEQFYYVVKYLKPKVNAGMDLTDLYLSVLFPVAVGKSDDFVLMGRGGFTDSTGKHYGMKALRQNPDFVREGADQILKSDVRRVITDRVSKMFVNLDASFVAPGEVARAVEQALHDAAAGR